MGGDVGWRLDGRVWEFFFLPPSTPSSPSESTREAQRAQRNGSSCGRGKSFFGQSGTGGGSRDMELLSGGC